MSSTKIINVLKDDKFEEILNIFRQSPAKEVIFVLPKKCKSFNDEQHFMVLSHEARNSDKAVSILCSNENTNIYARKYGFDVLLTKSPARKSKITAVNQVPDKTDEEPDEDPMNPVVDYGVDNEIEDEELEDDEADTVSTSNQEYEIITAAARSDIVHPAGKESKNIKLPNRKEKEADVGIQIADDVTDSFKELKEVWKKEGTWARRPSKHSFGFSFPKGRKTMYATLGLGALIVIGLIIYVTTGSAKVIVAPNKKDINSQIKVTASDNFSSVDTVFNKIPGQYFTVEKTISKEFAATGEKDVAQKARGTLTVYNELGQVQPLVATTRFSSADGHVFRTLKSITVPASKGSTPGKIDVEVIADKSGSEYNVPAGKFTVTAFQEKGDTLRASKVYGQSNQAMYGGTNGKAKVVAEIDISKANDEIKKLLKEAIDKDLGSETAGLRVVNSSDIGIIKSESTAKIDEPVDKFTVSITGSIKTVAFRDSDLHLIIAAYVDKNNGLTVVPEKLEISYSSPNISSQGTGNIMDFNVTVKGPGYVKINKDKIVSDLAGKSEAQIKTYLGTASGVDSARVLLSPFWVSKIPKNKDKISLELEYR